MEPSTNPSRETGWKPVLPLAAPAGSRAFLDRQRLERWTLAFLILGLAARCARYFLRFPLWEDECFLCCNLIDRDFRGLMEPLNYHQVAPLLFLWIQHAVVKLLGFHEMSLRLVPFLAGLGSLVLFWRLARQCLKGLPRLLAVAIFSVTYATIRYSAEAKPYGIDLFVALILISLTVNWLRDPQGRRWLWGLAAAIPLAVGLSYGAVMLGGGLSLAIAWVVWRQHRWESLAPWAVYTAALLASFAALYFVCIRGQESSDLEAMRDMWQEHFPPLNSVVDFAYWLLFQHTGDILAYPAGGSPFQSSLSSLCWFSALIALARRKQGTILILCLAPLAVTFVAAVMRRFPYGGAVRLNLYMAPFMCLLIGYGATVMLTWLDRFRLRPRLCLGALLGLLALMGGGCIVRDFATPYKNISDERARAFAEWFWYNAEHDGEVACVKTDLGRDFSPDTFHQLSFSAQYLCNQRIYSPRHAAGEAVDWTQISADRPLRCVLYRCPKFAFDDTAFQTWLKDMRQKYDLVGQDVYSDVRLKNTGRIIIVDSVEIFRFVPKGTNHETRIAARAP